MSAETTYQYNSGPAVESGRLATWLFLAAETLFFGGLISAWFVLRAQTPSWSEGEAPSLAMGMVMTALLLSTSYMGHGAVRAAVEERHKALAGHIAFAGLLAFTFLCMQVVEYAALYEHGAVPSASARWGAFYAITLAHGFHVLVGIVWLAWLMVQAVGPGLGGEARRPLEYGVLYLHFVDVIWLVLLVLLYVIS